MKGKARTSPVPSSYATSPGTSYLQPAQLPQPTQPAAETPTVAGSLPSARSGEFGSCAHHRLCAGPSQLWQWFAMEVPVLLEGGFVPAGLRGGCSLWIRCVNPPSSALPSSPESQWPRSNARPVSASLLTLRSTSGNSSPVKNSLVWREKPLMGQD